MAVFIFFSTAAGTSIVAANFRPHFNWFLLNGNITTTGFIKLVSFIGRVIIARRIYLGFVGVHLTHVGALAAAFTQWLRRFFLLG